MVEATNRAMDNMNVTHGNWREANDNPGAHFQKVLRIPEREKQKNSQGKSKHGECPF